MRWVDMPGCCIMKLPAKHVSAKHIAAEHVKGDYVSKKHASLILVKRV